MRGHSPYVHVFRSILLLGISLTISSCGDFQEPASGSPVTVTHISEAEFSNRTGSLVDPNAQSSSNTTAASPDQSKEAPAGTSSQMRSVAFSWDPSEEAHGYKVHLITASTSVIDIIDAGQATTVYLALRSGESYGFTVTAYDDAGESSAPPFVFFTLS